jgi:hypothetical protein
MQGPYGRGTLDLPPPSEWSWERNQLARGQTYRVSKAFEDADGDVHPVGEAWVFLGAMFNKFDDELTLCVRLPSGTEWKIPLLWRPDQQAAVIDRWSEFMTL